MSFEVNIKKKALKFISKLDKKSRAELGKALLLLKEDPVPIKLLDIAKSGREEYLSYGLVGSGVIYEVLWSDKIILIKKVDFRKTAYNRRSF